MKILYVNSFDSYTITATQEDANYPASNTQDSRLSKYYRSTDLLATYLTIDVGAGNTIQPTFAGIFAHNFSGSTDDYKIQSSDDNFVSIEDDLPLLTYTSDYVCSFIAPSTGRRYWRFKLLYSANTTAYYQIGRLWLGTSITLNTPFSIGFQENYIDTTKYQVSMSGQQYADEGYMMRKYNLNFPYLSNNERDTITTFVKDVKQAKKFLFVFNESDLESIDILYCYMNQETSFPHIFNNQWRWNLGLTEAL